MSDWLVIANGEFLVKEIIAEAAHNKKVVAADGAALKLLHLGIKPDVIIGDFDSFDASRINLHEFTIIAAHAQDKTDLMKAIDYCDSQHATSIHIICALGGRLDHHEGALRSLRTFFKTNRPIFLHSEQQTLRYARNETINIHGKIDDKCGILAYPQACFSSQGLKFEVNQFELNFGFSESICNSLMTERATVTITGEVLVIMPPQLSAQRDFMQKNLTERLSLQLRDAQLYSSEL